MKIIQWIFLVIAGAIIPFAIWAGGIGALYYLDIPSLIVIIIGGYALALASHGFAGLPGHIDWEREIISTTMNRENWQRRLSS
jgi:flagellar motor component MotA